jgi:DNA-binding HxlR family transcriptional regulator
MAKQIRSSRETPSKHLQARARELADAHDLRRSPCPIANTLDIVGDKWSLLVIRDLLGGERTYGELLASPEAIPTNILADRLKRLEEAGVIGSSVYQERPTRYAYALTRKGEALREIVEAFTRWGRKHLTGTKTLEELGLTRATGPATAGASASSRTSRR